MKKDAFTRLMAWFISRLKAFTAIRKRREAMVSDGRKTAVGIGLAGLVAAFTESVSIYGALTMLSLGLAIWFFAIRFIKPDDDDEKED